jgi:general secretion pathway protein I
MTSRRFRQSRGFTLLEILVAFAILGLAAGAIMTTFGAGNGKIASAEDERLAVLGARSVLAFVGTEIPLASGSQTGDMPGGIRWSVSIQPYDDGIPPADNSEIQPPFKLYAVAVRARAGTAPGKADALITTLRLGAP